MYLPVPILLITSSLLIFSVHDIFNTLTHLRDVVCEYTKVRQLNACSFVNYLVYNTAILFRDTPTKRKALNIAERIVTVIRTVWSNHFRYKRV